MLRRARHRRARRPEREARALAQARAHRTARGRDVGVRPHRRASSAATRSGARSSTARSSRPAPSRRRTAFSLRPASQWAIIDEMADETTTSAARDVAAGRRSELDAILGGVLRTAERLDVPCPTLDRARRRRRSSVSTPSAVAFVPARSGSERVPHKNVRPLAGHPLLAYAIETARQSGCFDRVVVSTDSEEIAEVARWYGADVPFLRPVEYATSTSPDIEWLSYTLERLDGAVRPLRARPRDQPVPRPRRRAARPRAAARRRRRPTRSARSSS